MGNKSKIQATRNNLNHAGQLAILVGFIISSLMLFVNIFTEYCLVSWAFGILYSTSILSLCFFLYAYFMDKDLKSSKKGKK